ncbi:MAG TPA: proline--tRNA ligase [Elusimicrobia bacterium]|nr:proline--tRNA ligase [Elusimicrobiota bacterium]
MRMSQDRYLVPTVREAPSDADNVSAALMIRAGLIRKLASGIYEWLPLGYRVLRKVERIVREEMDAAGGQEVWLPVIQPKELWLETGRWNVYGKELLRIKDRKEGEFCFAPTAEEVITDLVRREVRSWRQLPLMLYQFGLKFRDEIRPRFGVMRAREFYMKDAYSFHADEADAERYYKVMYDAYARAFTRIGLRFKGVEAQSGAIGGAFSHEFMVLAETGEETIVSCKQCSYAANLERAECLSDAKEPSEAPLPPELVHTPGVFTVEDVAKFMKAEPTKFLKTQLYLHEGRPVMALIRGDHELNEAKLARALGGGALERATEEQYVKIAGCAVGFAGPVNLPLWKTEKDGSVPVRILADHAIRGVANGISGGNKKDHHQKNLNFGKDFAVEAFADLRTALASDPCPRCGAATEFVRGIEVGHVFKLGTKYSQALNAVYVDAEQKSHTMVMGCYGIGVSRIVAAAIEQGNDKDGIIWPAPIAPFKALIVPVETDDAAVLAEANRLHDELNLKGVETMMDDRPERAGVRFKDCDLIGIPYRLVVSKKTLAAGQVEFKKRAAADKEMWPASEAVARLLALG